MERNVPANWVIDVHSVENSYLHEINGTLGLDF